MAWWSRRPRPARPAGPPVGLGVLVAVTSPDGVSDAWYGEPVGVVVQGGVNEIYGYPGVATPRFWTVAFDDLAYMVDGRGPFEKANVPEWRLRVLEPEAAEGPQPEP